MRSTYTPNLVILAHSLLFKSYNSNKTWTDRRRDGQHYKFMMKIPLPLQLLGIIDKIDDDYDYFRLSIPKKIS